MEELFDGNDFKVIEKYREFPEGYLYFNRISGKEHNDYASVEFVKNPEKGEERYFGYLFHFDIAKAIRFWRGKNLHRFTSKYLVKPVGRIRVRKGDVKGVRGMLVYVKNKKVNKILLAASDDYILTYLLVEAGEPVERFLHKNRNKMEEIFFGIGELFAELQKAGFYHNEFYTQHIFVFNGQVKLIDLYDNRSFSEFPTSLIPIKEAGIDRRKHIFRITQAFTVSYTLLLDLGIKEMDEGVKLIREMIEGYSSVKDNDYREVGFEGISSFIRNLEMGWVVPRRGLISRDQTKKLHDLLKELR